MCRIEFPKHRAVHPLIGPRGAEFGSAEHRRFPLGHLNAPHAAANVHGVLHATFDLMPPEWSRSYCPDRHQQAEDLAPKASEIDQRSLEGGHLIPRGDQRFDSRLLQERVERTSNYVD